MGRIIKLEVDKETYTLEFNRRTLLLASEIQEEFKDNSSIAEKFTVLSKLARIAFLKNHPNITQDEVDNIIDSIEDLDGFFKSITEIMESSVDVLKTQKKGNARWEVK